jgi:hypothetical protein
VADSEKRGLIIHFTDGTKKVLEFPVQLKDDSSAMLRIKELLDSPYLAIEAEGALIMIPMSSVKYLQAYPAPKKLPANVIRGASFRD